MRDNLINEVNINELPETLQDLHTDLIDRMVKSLPTLRVVFNLAIYVSLALTSCNNHPQDQRQNQLRSNAR